MLHTLKGKPILLYDDLSFRLEGGEIGVLDERGRGLNIQMHPISIYLISSVQLILFLGIFLGYGINKIECYLFPDEEIKITNSARLY